MLLFRPKSNFPLPWNSVLGYVVTGLRLKWRYLRLHKFRGTDSSRWPTEAHSADRHTEESAVYPEEG